MGPQRRFGIYVGFYSPSIIRYLESLTDDVFSSPCEDCQFNEIIFPPLGGEWSLPEVRRKTVFPLLGRGKSMPKAR